MVGDGDQAQALRGVAAVGSAYVVQGLVAAVGGVLLGALAQAGTGLEQQAGLLAGGAIPWVLKCIAALSLDMTTSWSMRLRAAVLATLQLCIAACLWGLAAAWAEREASGAASLTPIAIAWISLNFIAALQDVVTDNLALDTLRGHQPWTAMAMGSGHAIGMGVLGSLVLGETIGEQGMVAGFRAPAMWIAIVALACAALLWLPGRPARAASSSPRERWPSGAQLWALLGLAILYAALMFGTNLTAAISSEFVFGHLEWDLLDYMRVVMPIATLATLAGALAMGPLAAKLGPARASMLAGAALGLIWIWLAGASSLWRAPAMLPSYAACEAFLTASLLAGLYALALIASARSPLPTTTFVLLMTAINLPRALAPPLAPTLVELGWIGAFAACGAIQLIAVAGLWPLRGWTAKR